MSHKLPTSRNALQILAADLADGLKTHTAAVGVKLNTEDKVRADLAALKNADADFQTARAAKLALTTAHTVADSNAKAGLAAARKILAIYLGERWTQAWTETGFPNQSTAVPATADERFDLLDRLAACLTAHPDWENEKLGVTAAQARALHQPLQTARQNLNAGLAALGQKKQILATAEAALRTRLTNSIAELGQLLTDDDPRWLAFGLPMPGGHSRPDAIEHLSATPGQPGTILLDWTDAPRAAHYRIWRQIPGVDADFVEIQTRDESDATLTGLPSGQTEKFKVNACNDAGEGPDSEVIEAKIP